LKKSTPQNIIRPLIKLQKSWLGNYNINELELTILGQRRYQSKVIDALIAAQRANINLVFKTRLLLLIAGS